MRQYPLPLALAVFLLVGAGCLGAAQVSRPATPAPTTPAAQITTPTPAPTTPTPTPPPSEPHVGGNSGQALMTDKIVVNAPTVGATITSPLVITGEARGPWFFEGSFPVQLKNASGVVIASGIAHEVTPGTWMTVNFVPFTSTLSFAPQPAGSTGTLILMKDDPSGENPDSVTISVTF